MRMRREVLVELAWWLMHAADRIDVTEALRHRRGLDRANELAKLGAQGVLFDNVVPSAHRARSCGGRKRA